MRKLTPARQFQLASLLVLMVGMLVTGWWLNWQIEQGVAQEAVRLNSLYIGSFIAPRLQDVAGSAVMSPSDIAAMNSTVGDVLFRDGIVALCVWNARGRILYSSIPAQIGHVYAPDSELHAAFAGQISWELSNNPDEEWIPPLPHPRALLGFYSPVRRPRTDQIIAVAEVYKLADSLLQDIAAAQQRTWVAMLGATTVMYLLLAGFIQHMSDTVVRQQGELTSRVQRLRELLTQNELLRDRARQATRRVASLHERVLRAISADLHDGPAQSLGLALLRLDPVVAYHEEHPNQQVDEHLAVVKGSLGQAMHEVRAIASGLAMPQLDSTSLTDMVAQVVRAHERNYHLHVTLEVQPLIEHVDLAIKTTLYRLLQEGLSNACRHGRGIDVRVSVTADGGVLAIAISDRGPGFEVNTSIQSNGHMGLSGMRDRVESLGGRFDIRSGPGMGTRIQIRLPLVDHDESR